MRKYTTFIILFVIGVFIGIFPAFIRLPVPLDCILDCNQGIGFPFVYLPLLGSEHIGVITPGDFNYISFALNLIIIIFMATSITFLIEKLLKNNSTK